MLTSKTVSAVFKRYIKLREEKKSWFFPPFLKLWFRAILHNGDNDQNINRKTNLIWNSYQLWQIPLSWQSMTHFLKKIFVDVHGICLFDFISFWHRWEFCCFLFETNHSICCWCLVKSRLSFSRKYGILFLSTKLFTEKSKFSWLRTEQ